MALFVPDVQRQADTDKNALGFLPASVYEDAADSENLLVAVVPNSGLNKYSGHLLFGGRFPHGKIYQLYVTPEFRKKSVARALIDKLVEWMERCNFLSISARVAEDLPANVAWEALGFELAGVKTGGSSRKRMLNVRVFFFPPVSRREENELR